MADDEAMKYEINKLNGPQDYENWRFQLISVLRAKGLWETKVEAKLLTGTATFEDSEAKALRTIHACIVAKLGEKPLQLVQQFDCDTVAEVIKKLDDVYRQSNLSARQQLLLDLVGRKKQADESITDFIGSKWSLAKQRLKTVTVDELILLGITTCLGPEFNTVCSELRSIENLTFDTCQRRLTEFASSLDSSSKELTGNTIALVGTTSESSSGSNANTQEKKTDANTSTKDTPAVVDKTTKKLLKQVRALKGAVFNGGGKGGGKNNRGKGRDSKGWRGHPYKQPRQDNGGNWNSNDWNGGWQEDWQPTKKGGGKKQWKQ